VRIKFRPGRLELQDVLNYSAITSDPTLRGVFNEDIVSILADGVALVALAVNQITGSSIAEGVAAVLIGAVLIRIGLRLVQRNRDFLLGQPTQQFDTERIRSLLLGYPGVSAIRELIVTFVGPGRIWIIARVDVDQGLSGDQVISLVRGIESSATHASEYVYRVNVMPVGGAQALP
jgi:divalent metal cation (Fe/Co/Zn/Cd) transporter